ncbi:MAG: hypothetical protein HQL66_04410 [Magnetococcales bacterium]|nr:hypothetical protein [Magnetococcales bacterium]
MKNIRYAAWPIGAVFVLALLVLEGCVGDTQGPSRPVNTAIAPPAMDLPNRVAMLPFLDMTRQEYPLTMVRPVLFNHLARKNYQLTPWPDSDARLAIAFDGRLELAITRETTELCQLLEVDGLWRGEIVHYNPGGAREAEAIPSLTVRLRLEDVRGRIVWQGERRGDARSYRQATDPPTPLGRLLGQAKAVLSGRDLRLFYVAEHLAMELVSTLPEPPVPPGDARLWIDDVIHDGGGRVLGQGDILQLAISGTPEMIATTRIPGLKPIYMTESPQTPGYYTARVLFGPHEQVDHAPVIGMLQNHLGLTRENVAPLGTVTVDNRVPARMSDIKQDVLGNIGDIASLSLRGEEHGGGKRDMGSNR